MSITDELREWAHGFTDLYVNNERQLLAIADRIDAEHEADVSTACRLAAGLDDDALAKRGYIALPVDADGVPIRVGDTIEIEHNGRVTTVTNINYNEYGWQVYCAEGGGFGKDTRCRHVQPDTWERIIEDAMSFEGDGWYSTRDDAMAELVERCRRLAGGA